MTTENAAMLDNDAIPAMTFFGKMLTFSRLQLNTNDLTVIEAQLNQTLQNKISQIPIVIDSSVDQDLDALVDLLWSWGLQPIGVVKGILEDQARALRLAIFPADGNRIERIVPKPKKEPKADQKSAQEPAAAQAIIPPVPDQVTNLIYDQILRSGQSLNHVGGDLILTNGINRGAEAITDNSLHVYGRAQGRLVAGATGDKDARIFCQMFNPSLVSVAGTYCLHDNLPEHIIDKPVQVRFKEDEGLVFTVMEDF
ncbi:septum site-determining protein MinC [Psychrobacter ciconiae]|uniref:septum site-determining protein MinC n=1 Tax=Psychrobacter ciconiae TaxID=1553449 RepID=UPI00191B2776|nr:septum site-determining protein MinC [Psychrobacter ciconiae]